MKKIESKVRPGLKENVLFTIESLGLIIQNIRLGYMPFEIRGNVVFVYCEVAEDERILIGAIRARGGMQPNGESCILDLWVMDGFGWVMSGYWEIILEAMPGSMPKRKGPGGSKSKYTFEQKLRVVEGYYRYKKEIGGNIEDYLAEKGIEISSKQFSRAWIKECKPILYMMTKID